MTIAAIWLAAALSGAAGVAYEVLWSRALVVPLGNSSDAAALVFAGFMIGIAVGAWLGGESKTRSPLRLYAALELLLGGYALIAPALLARLTGIPSVFLRQSSALGLVVIPCLAMGASIPLLVRGLRGPIAREISIAYGANTAGAAIGALATGFFAIARLGVVRSSRWAAVASALAALFAFAASRRPIEVEREASSAPGSRVALFVAFVSGFVMLGCELLWARVLTFVFGHDAYAFASLLVVVLVGLAIGGFVHRLLAGRDQTAVLYWALAAFALSILLSYWGATALVVHRGRDPFAIASSELSVSVWIEMWRALAYAPLLALLPALLSGLIFPAACALHGRKIGEVYLANGLGSALGAVIAALALVQLLGIQGAFIALAIGSAASLLSLRRSGIVPLLAVVAISLVMPRALPKQMLLQAFGNAHQQLVHYQEGRTGTVSVIVNDINGEKELLMNGINEVTTRLVHDQSFKILGHLGPLLHPNPKRAVMICLGAGLSAGATLRHPIDSLDVVDLSAIVQNGARKFALENNHALDDPRLHLHIEDGRQFLLNSAGNYDVAVIDSTHPKAVDSWILYTKEFYELVRARLGEGGIVVQWLPLHGLSEREFKIIVRTFASAFPEMTLWANAGFETYGPVGYAKLVGAKGPLVIDAKALDRRLEDPKIRADLAPFGLSTAAEILSLFVARADAVRAWTEGLPLQTDDHPMVPYTTEWTGGRKMIPSFFLAIRSPALHEPALEAAWEGQGLVLSGMLTRAVELHPESPTIRLFVAQAQTTKPYYEAFADRYPHDGEKLFEAANQLGGAGEGASAQAVYRRALALHPHDFRLRLNLALLLVQMGDLEAGLKILSALRDEQPKSATVLYNLGAALLENGDPAAARVQLELALGWDPALGRARLALAVALFQLNELDRAEAAVRAVLAENPWIAEAHDLEGSIEARRDHLDRAQIHFRRAIEIQPYRASYHFDLASVLAGTEAENELLLVIRLEPRHLEALDRLGSLLLARGEKEGAALRFQQALDVDPRFAIAAHHLGQARRAQGLAAEAKNAFCAAFALGFEPSRSGCNP